MQADLCLQQRWPCLLRHPAQMPDSSLTCKHTKGLPEGTCWGRVRSITLSAQQHAGQHLRTVFARLC